MPIDPRPLAAAHFATLTNAETGKRRPFDLFVFYGPPLVPAAAGAVWGFDLSPVAAAALLTVTGLLGAFLFTTMLEASQRAIDWADLAAAAAAAGNGPPAGSDAAEQENDDADFLKGTAANAGYAALTLSVSSLCFVVSTVTSGDPNTIAASAGLAIGLHGFLTLLMVVDRVFATTVARLEEVKSGRDE